MTIYSMRSAGLVWGSFTPIHILSLVLSLLIALGLHFLLRKRSPAVQKTVLFLLSLYGVFALVYELVAWGIPTTPLQYLPLHMCAYNAMLTPILVLTQNRLLGNLVPLFSTGAAIALIFNSIQADYEINSFVFISYYATHTLGACIPWLMISLGLVRPHPRYALPAAGMTVGLYTVSHIANLAINAYLVTTDLVDYLGNPVRVNYMFSVDPMGNPLLSLFWSIIPHEYFYMFCAFPILALYFILLNCRYITVFCRVRHAGRKKATR